MATLVYHNSSTPFPMPTAKEQKVRSVLSSILICTALLAALYLGPQAQSKMLHERSKHTDAAFWRAVAFQGQKSLIIVDAKTGAIVDMNAAAEQLLGWSRDQLTGRQFYPLLPEPQRTEHRQFLEDSEWQRLLLARVCGGAGYINTAKGEPVKVSVTVTGLNRDRYYFVVTLVKADEILQVLPRPGTPDPEVLAPEDFGPKIDVEAWKEAFADG